MRTRPTSDRVREALFNILARKPVGAAVLDLFAGTGALGIESLSRGARMAVFVDKSRSVLAVLRKNIALCGLDASSKAIQWDIAANLNCLQPYPHCFNLVFMDPPYMRHLIDPALSHLLDSQALAKDALIVVEHSPDEFFGRETRSLTCIDLRRYGRTALSILALRSQSIASSSNPC